MNPLGLVLFGYIVYALVVRRENDILVLYVKAMILAIALGAFFHFFVFPQ